MANSLNALPKENAAPEITPQPQRSSSPKEKQGEAIDRQLEQTPGGQQIKDTISTGLDIARAIPEVAKTIGAVEELSSDEDEGGVQDVLSDTPEEDSEEPEEIEPMGLIAFLLLLTPAALLDLIDAIDLILELAGLATAGTFSVVWGIISLALDIVGSIGMGIATWIIGDAYLKSNMESIKKLAKTLLWAVRIGIVIFGIADDIPVIEALPFECLTVVALYVASPFLSREEINARAQAATEKINKVAGKAATKHNLEHPENLVSTAENNRTGSKRLERREQATTALNRFVET